MWRYGKLKGKFSDGEMNDRFIDIGFSQGHQSCVGGSPIFQSGKSAKPWATEGALKPWHTWWSNPQRCRHRGFNAQRLDHSATLLLAKMQNKDANKREPKTWKGWNAKWINDFDFCLFAVAISNFCFFDWAFSLSQFRVLISSFKNQRQSLTYYCHSS